MMPLFRQERCGPWASIRCHADFTSHERQYHSAQHDYNEQERKRKEKNTQINAKHLLEDKEGNVGDVLNNIDLVTAANK